MWAAPLLATDTKDLWSKQQKPRKSSVMVDSWRTPWFIPPHYAAVLAELGRGPTTSLSNCPPLIQGRPSRKVARKSSWLTKELGENATGDERWCIGERDAVVEIKERKIICRAQLYLNLQCFFSLLPRELKQAPWREILVSFGPL